MAEYIPFWGSNDPEESSAWDRCEIGGIVLPGVSRVRCPTKREIDGKASPGSDGATFTDKGKAPAHVRITTRIHERVEWEVWLTAREQLDPLRNGGLKQPKTIEHPKTALAGIESIYVTSIEESDPNPKSGMTITIDAIQWMKQATKTNSKQTHAASLEDEWGKQYEDEEGKMSVDPAQSGGEDDLTTNTFGPKMGAKTIKGLA